MSATIFCTFEQRDLADLAIGQIRSIPGIERVQYTAGDLERRQQRDYTDGTGFSYFNVGSALPFSISGGSDYRMSGNPTSDPTRVKITCSDMARQKVKAALVNLHAYNITVH